MRRVVGTLRDCVELRSPRGATVPELEDGTQYYRLHPDVTAPAARRLAHRLEPYTARPWTQWPCRNR
jgi:hypothetical protein